MIYIICSFCKIILSFLGFFVLFPALYLYMYVVDLNIIDNLKVDFVKYYCLLLIGCQVFYLSTCNPKSLGQGQ